MMDCCCTSNPPCASMIVGGEVSNYRRSWAAGGMYFFTMALLEWKRGLLHAGFLSCEGSLPEAICKKR